MTLTAQSSMPAEAIRAAAGEGFIVPKKAKNPAGGKEMLRAMLSKDAATNFSKTKLAPTIVKGIVPADGFGSSALKSQSAMLDAAGDNVFNFQFYDYYGTNTDELVVWNSFLSGDIDVKTLTSKVQAIFDKVADDPSVKKLKIT
jgi:N-acetylglucosamine transport system substrate-binding protein